MLMLWSGDASDDFPRDVDEEGNIFLDRRRECGVPTKITRTHPNGTSAEGIAVAHPAGEIPYAWMHSRAWHSRGGLVKCRHPNRSLSDRHQPPVFGGRWDRSRSTFTATIRRISAVFWPTCGTHPRN